mmetsp:Transcript_23365/g.38668  ORF Transcript_23365/g.38668 Transcript_23365/m.38668 type:complete len:200 (-) Transcript_23365:795-1394(-)
MDVDPKGSFPRGCPNLSNVMQPLGIFNERIPILILRGGRHAVRTHLLVSIADGMNVGNVTELQRGTNIMRRILIPVSTGPIGHGTGTGSHVHNFERRSWIHRDAHIRLTGQFLDIRAARFVRASIQTKGIGTGRRLGNVSQIKFIGGIAIALQPHLGLGGAPQGGAVDPGTPRESDQPLFGSEGSALSQDALGFLGGFW